MSKFVIIIVIVIVLMLVGIWFLSRSSEPAEASPLAPFAQCLADKGVTMYGANWCAHCQNEKKAFGSAFKYVPYIECPKNTKLCIEKGIQGYPTWLLGDGKKLEGEQGLRKLANESGCTLPQ